MPIPEESEESQEEAKVREIKDDEDLILEAYACGNTVQPKKITLNLDSDRSKIIKDLCVGGGHGKKVPKYFDIVDFDEHFTDVSLDWTNPMFN